MKIKLLFLLASGYLSAQNAALFNNSWYISKIVNSGQTAMAPAMSQSINSSVFLQYNSDYVFNSQYFNIAGVQISFSSTQNSFSKTGFTCTLADYHGPNWQAAQEFDQKNCSFYYVPNAGVFNYEILTNGTSKTLIITNAATGDQVFYNNALLGTKDDLKKQNFRIFPNPSSDFIVVENLKKNLKIQIYDLSGKMVLETLSSGNLLKIDIQSLQKGQYLLSIEDFKTEFFIKQ